MKVVFPCSGSLVLLKQDLERLKSFYNTNLLTSKMLDTYKNTTSMIQVGNFNYIPPTNSVVLYNANVLTIKKMREILGIFNEEQLQEDRAIEKNPNITENREDLEPIYDEDLLSNPFFTTLTPLN